MAEEPINRHWVNNLPVPAVDRADLVLQQIICCGVNLAPAEAMREFCAALSQRLRWSGVRIGLRTMDQPWVMYLARIARPELFRVLPAGNPVIAHCGGNWTRDYRWIDGHGLTDIAGNLVAVVHLYDRKRVLVDGFSNLLGVTCRAHQYAA